MIVMRTVLDLPPYVSIGDIEAAVEAVRGYAAPQLIADGGLPRQIAIEFKLDAADDVGLLQQGIELASFIDEINTNLSVGGVPEIEAAALEVTRNPLVRRRDVSGRQVLGTACPTCGAAAKAPCHFIDGTTEDENRLLAFCHQERVDDGAAAN